VSGSSETSKKYGFFSIFNSNINYIDFIFKNIKFGLDKIKKAPIISLEMQKKLSFYFWYMFSF